MKKTISLVLVAVMILAFYSVSNAAAISYFAVKTEQVIQQEYAPRQIGEDGEKINVLFGRVPYIRVMSPSAVKIYSVEELDNYFSADRSFFASGKYDESFFHEKFLFLFHIAEPSGGNELEFTSLTENAEAIEVEITRVVDGNITNIGYWLLILEIDRDLIGKDISVTIAHDLMCYAENLSYYKNTSGYYEEPYTVKINSVQELNDYYENKIKPLPHAIDGYGNILLFPIESEIFLNPQYDESFFQHRTLIFAVAAAESGSIRYQLSSIRERNGLLELAIDKIIPEVGTTDMAYWHIAFDMIKVWARYDISLKINNMGYIRETEDITVVEKDYNFTLSMASAQSGLKAGDTLLVDIMLKGDKNYSQVNTSINYDANLLEFSGFANIGGLIGEVKKEGADKINVRSVASLNIAVGAPCAAPLRVVTLKFTVKGNFSAASIATDLNFASIAITPAAGITGATTAPGKALPITLQK
ncbi:MAG: cohesin domain-containing protein [Clostridiales bacterium]|nr:cohesin domain-containing protein [Clostridiales bacterium]